mmetsp:Transcript_2408/g.2454  ORF Transcript_2408/g.2454 Transcript_2408/m.2454 type:complete len:348 (-) Transcript_2408:418-1461(-)|eukprot:CAMPEP_0171313624 /NCGR_PEP_ID=MMETSP0816-20121228/44349_1 /TAXON_ID=420281 /ORGANISM="Proboscia inermis, Strain CCAP1064/1" /LENGTH=347 /DNA_ID=CAMNT_0011801299 /DNA_START=305 /DNA_END=1348 /DNA_ORIENTATION=+
MAVSENKTVTSDELRSWCDKIIGFAMTNEQFQSILGEEHSGRANIGKDHFVDILGKLDSINDENFMTSLDTFDEASNNNEEWNDSYVSSLASRALTEAVRICADDAKNDQAIIRKISESVFTTRTSIMKAFVDFDLDSSGKLDASDLGSVLQKAGLDISEERIKSLIQKFDRDKDGKLGRSEFALLISSASKVGTPRQSPGVVKSTKSKFSFEKIDSRSPTATSLNVIEHDEGEEIRKGLATCVSGHENEIVADGIKKMETTDIQTIVLFQEAFEKEMIRTRTMFKNADLNNSMDLNITELKNVFVQLGVDVSDEHMDYVMKRFGGSNGRLRYGQFVKLVSSHLEDS